MGQFDHIARIFNFLMATNFCKSLLLAVCRHTTCPGRLVRARVEVSIVEIHIEDHKSEKSIIEKKQIEL